MFARSNFLDRAWITGILLVLFLGGCEKARLDEEVRRLCAKDGGVKVHEFVGLNESDYKKLLNDYGELEIRSKKLANPSDEFYTELVTTYIKKGSPELWRSEYQLIRRADEKILAISIYYTRRGGDLPSPLNDSSFSCPSTKENPRLVDLVIKKAH
jgi:hypothetical protein